MDVGKDSVGDESSELNVPETVYNLNAKQRKNISKFFGSPKLSSQKADSLLGPSNDSYTPMLKSTQKLRDERLKHKKEIIESILSRKIELNQYKIPDGTHVTQKFLKLCGDKTMEHMAQRHYKDKKHLSGKVLKMLGTTELISGTAKKIIGPDAFEEETEVKIKKEVDRLNQCYDRKW